MTPIKLIPNSFVASTSSRKVLDLEPVFREKVMAMLKTCRDRGTTMQVTSTIRGPEVQAQLWCQSRRPKMIEEQAKALVGVGAPWLASLLKPEYFKGTKSVTNALPGLSWHQWGEAVDCVVVEGKMAVWNVEHRGWGVYVQAAAEHGLFSASHWKSFPEWPHVQLRPDNSPLSLGMKWPEIEEEMKKRYGAQEQPA